MRFLADENVTRHVIEKLRADGHEVPSIAREQPGVSDPEVLGVAQSANSVLITEDQDFCELVIRQRLPVRGVILMELDRLSNIAEAQRISDVVVRHEDQFVGNLVIVEPGRVRVRPLPSPI